MDSVGERVKDLSEEAYLKETEIRLFRRQITDQRFQIRQQAETIARMDEQSK
jgi:hypothetical protein